MSRGVLFSLIVIVAAVSGWFTYQEVQRSKTLSAPTNEFVRLPESSSPLNAVPDKATGQELPNTVSGSSDDLAATDLSEIASPPLQSQPLVANNEAPPTPSETSSTTGPQTDASMSSEPASEASTPPETTAAPSDTVPQCSSFDEAGLLAAFDDALAAFLVDATTTYGSRYENLQYQLSGKQGTIDGEQGMVKTHYSGTVNELSTGQNVSANGTISATFNWDGCTWQLVDYSF